MALPSDGVHSASTTGAVAAATLALTASTSTEKVLSCSASSFKSAALDCCET